MQMTEMPETASPAATTLVSYIEIWSPEPADATADPDAVESKSPCLRLDGAWSVHDQGVDTVLPTTTVVGRGEGIAGSAWQQKGAVIQQDHPSAILDRTSAQCGRSLSAVVAFPVFCGYELIGVVVMGLTQGPGGVEIWSRDDRDELAISGSRYSGLKTFDYISQYVRFPKGAGLPGYCWKHDRPRMVEQPAVNPNFIRSFDRDPARLSDCVGLPIGRDFSFPASVLLLLSDESTPFANAIDIWQCESIPPTSDSPTPAIAFESNSKSNSTWEPSFTNSLCTRMAKTRRAVLVNREEASLPEGASAVLAVPYFTKDAITEILVMVY